MLRIAFPLVIALSLALTSCKKPSEEAAAPATQDAVAQATPEPTPTPAPEPTPEPIDTTAQVIVLCYHRFEEKPREGLAIKPADFEAQMQALKDAGISVISMEDFLAWRKGEKNIPPKSAIITIDDGYVSGYTHAWPILKKFGYPFTMFVYTDYVKGGPKAGGQSITWDQLGEMRDAGVDIGSHTVSHSALNARKGKTEEQYLEWVKHELAGSKEMIESQLGIVVKTLAYPYGLHNDAVNKAVHEAGYEAAFTVYGQRIPYGAEATLLGRYAIDSTKPKIFTDAISFTGGIAPASKVMPAAATMVTQPMEGETISDPMPELKANLATLGKIDPSTITMRVSGIGLVPARYDENTKLLTYKLAQPLKTRHVTVIVSAMSSGRKVETRWSFGFDPVAAPAPASTNP